MNTYKSSVFDFSDLERVFDDLTVLSPTKCSNYDIIQNKNEQILEIALPGIPKENINIEIDKNRLLITAERIERDVEYTHRTSKFGKTCNTFTIPADIKIENILAEYIDGVLKITLPRGENENKKNVIKII